MAREDRGTGGPPTGGAVLPTAGCTENLTPGSTERPPGGKQEAQGLETAVCDSVDWPDSGGRIVGYFADPAPVSYQAPVVDLLWAWCGDQFQRRSRGCERPTPTEEEACGDSRTKRELQSRSEESVQGGPSWLRSSPARWRSSTQSWWPKACGRSRYALP